MAVWPVPGPVSSPFAHLPRNWVEFCSRFSISLRFSDIDLTAEDDFFGTADIEILDDDDPFLDECDEIIFHRSEFVDSSSGRQQVNELTSFVDGSNVYGSDATTAASLRAPNGRMATTQNGDMLPDSGTTDGFLGESFLRISKERMNTSIPHPSRRRSLSSSAGDVRANEHIGLTSMHTLFVREHIA